LGAFPITLALMEVLIDHTLLGCLLDEVASLSSTTNYNMSIQKKYKVLVIAFYFRPMSNAGVYRITGFIKHLPSLGFFPIVLTAPRHLDIKEGGLLLEQEIPSKGR